MVPAGNRTLHHPLHWTENNRVSDHLIRCVESLCCPYQPTHPETSHLSPSVGCLHLRVLESSASFLSATGPRGPLSPRLPLVSTIPGLGIGL